MPRKGRPIVYLVPGDVPEDLWCVFDFDDQPLIMSGGKKRLHVLCQCPACRETRYLRVANVRASIRKNEFTGYCQVCNEWAGGSDRFQEAKDLKARFPDVFADWSIPLLHVHINEIGLAAIRHEAKNAEWANSTAAKQWEKAQEELCDLMIEMHRAVNED